MGSDPQNTVETAGTETDHRRSDPYRRAMVHAFTKSYSIARSFLELHHSRADAQQLDATGVDLSGMYVAFASLPRIFMRNASLQGTEVYRVDLHRADLTGLLIDNNTNIRSSDLTG